MTMLIGGPIPPLRRDLEMTQIEHEGQPMFLLSDIIGLEDKSYVVSMSVVLVASLFNGQKRASDVSLELAKQKITLSEAQIQSMADQLETSGLLETPSTQETRERLFEDFQKSTVRRLRAKTRGLPEDALELGAMLGQFYAAPKGPGDPASKGEGEKTPVGLVSPHIDFFRGGATYAWAYGQLAGTSPPDVVVGVGVAHLSPQSPWIMTKKSYETPFGHMEVDGDLYAEIRGALWYDPLDEEWVHAKEHSLEFQSLWLKYLWRDKTPKWVPILCSAFDRFCEDRPPSKVETIDKAISKIGEILRKRAEAGQKILVLAGVDLAHVGRRFGDEMDMTPDLEKKIEDLDRASMDKALRLDSDGFFMDGVGENAWRKVCGLSALYTSLRWIKDISGGKEAGRLLAYDKAPDPAGGVVSFASAVFDR